MDGCCHRELLLVWVLNGLAGLSKFGYSRLLRLMPLTAVLWTGHGSVTVLSVVLSVPSRVRHGTARIRLWTLWCTDLQQHRDLSVHDFYELTEILDCQ